MSTDNPSSVSIQTDALPMASVPAWFGEVALLAHTLTRLGLLSEISEHVRFTRKRFGKFEVIDFVVMLLGYAISGEPTLKAYYERLQPFASTFMALFGRSSLPHRATLSRFLAALDETAVEALRSVFLRDAQARLGSEAEGDSGTDREIGGWSSISMAPDRPHDNVLCLKGRNCHHRTGVCLRSVRPATPDASVGKSFGPGPRSYRPIPISGSSPVEQLGMEITEASCCGHSL
jgi:hypothetical protein